MSLFPLKPTHAPVKAYYAALAQFEKHGFVTEGNTRDAFAALLRHCARGFDLELTPEVNFIGTGKQRLRADAILYDKTSMSLRHGFWEAKDTADNLPQEVKRKIADGYPTINTLFQSPDHAILYQNNRIAFDESIRSPQKLVDVLELFFTYQHKDIADWREAVEKFSGKLPELAADILAILANERKTNPEYRAAYDAFADLCRQSINPDLHDDAIQKMLVQHLLTERIFRNIFDNKELLQRNVIAAEIEKVIHLITKRHFSRDTFLKRIERFYTAIEAAARQTETYAEKQHFLNVVYERFFQNFDPREADTHGIVYTPQPIVDFMVRSVEEILRAEFGKSLSDSGVHILDPFTGTGNFITRIMQQIKRSSLPQKYAEELHCNEIMLLPYYIASMNIEHAYMERLRHGDELGDYRPFEGICLVDTFELSEFGQQSFAFSDSNTARVLKQKKAPIFVVIGNPPYNMGQENENDQNKNRKYKHWDNRIKDTYTKDSKATLRNKLSDPYVKAFRWASDRIRNGGIIAFVTNNSYIDQIAFDGMRHHLARDFSKLYLLDLGGNVRKNPKLSGTTHNVFGIQVGVSISLLVKKPDHKGNGEVLYARMPGDWKRGQKYNQLDEWKTAQGLSWKTLKPDTKNTWLTAGQRSDYETLIPLGDKKDKGGEELESIYRLFSLGIISNRDGYVWNWSAQSVEQSMRVSVDHYLAALRAYKAEKHPRPKAIDYIDADDPKIKWTRQTIVSLEHFLFYCRPFRASLNQA
jgi:predicted helicase